MANLKCVVVTPEQTVLEAEAEFVALPLYDGEIGIAPGRGAMIGRLGFGEMRLRRGGDVERWYVDGGFVQVSKDVISVLTAKAIVAKEVDEQAARTQIEAAMKKPIHTPELLEIRERALAQGRAQVRVAQKAK
jgi:F-type H+-transporting ATPase subunit epsilon